MVWKSNFDCIEYGDTVRLQHKTGPSIQAPPASSTVHLPSNLNPSALRSQVRSDSWRQTQSSDVKYILMCSI